MSLGWGTIQSLDTGAQVLCTLGSEGTWQTREIAAVWDEAGVAQADPQPSEYKHTKPAIWTIRVTFEDYRTDGMGGSVEQQYNTLLAFTKLAPGKHRAHRLMFQSGNVVFGPCFLESCSFPVKRTNNDGEALIALDVTITLKLLQGTL